MHVSALTSQPLISYTIKKQTRHKRIPPESDQQESEEGWFPITLLPRRQPHWGGLS